MGETTTHRHRRRAETEAEIKAHAWAAMRESGPAVLSLRHVAREMGMAPSALYRYFASRNDLLTALIVDAYESLGEQVNETYVRASATGQNAFEVFMAVAHTYRGWAMSHRTEWALIFSTSLPDYNGTPETYAAAGRSFGVLIQLTADAVAGGLIDVDRLDRTLDDDLRTSMRVWAEHTGQELPAGALAGSMWCYSVMHGAISLDLNGQFPPPMADSPALFDSALRAMLAQLTPTD
ncbi:TetR/AcrR family transcriptional regulator [Winogradskya consettensis]|uniref:TetR family transcriptional regulator n=1 Tax=Winogradskya consettensis TaxID=113560 RepID=A0A919SKX6_9ACTN|nr:TetR/AcrR family transcriptional regulator [Actinoplanes consettensis]GIM72848.1 TetR family transcriptional regulator [Actinoplanes consettensis]